MAPRSEKRLLQAAVVLAGAFSLFVAVASIVRGTHLILPAAAPLDIDLDSHFRYLSGIFLGLLIAFYSCVPAIERKAARFRLLGGLVVCGGVARLLGLTVGVPGTGHIYGLAMELVVTPLLLLWQARVAARFGEATPATRSPQ